MYNKVIKLIYGQFAIVTHFYYSVDTDGSRWYSVIVNSTQGKETKNMNRQKITTIVLCALFAAITAILSQIAIPMPSGVPVTLQTFAVALCGFYLCTARATVSTLVYVLLGAVGVPVFSGFKGGIASIVGPTGGFIIGFIAMAAISGIAFRNMPEKFRVPLRIAMGILGVAACHICGFVQYALVAGKDLLSSFLLVSAPYLIKDIVSVVLAYFAALAISKALKRTGFAPSEQA